MKKIILAIAFLFAIILTGCSSISQDTPEAALESFINAEKTNNFRAWSKLWSNPDSFYEWQFNSICENDKDKIFEILKDETTISGEEATVYVNVTSEGETDNCFAELVQKNGKWFLTYVNF